MRKFSRYGMRTPGLGDHGDGFGTAAGVGCLGDGPHGIGDAVVQVLGDGGGARVDASGLVDGLEAGKGGDEAAPGHVDCDGSAVGGDVAGDAEVAVLAGVFDKE
jgi:hypothetical protein